MHALLSGHCNHLYLYRFSSYGGIRKLMLDLFSPSFPSAFESQLFQLDTVALGTVLTYD